MHMSFAFGLIKDTIPTVLDALGARGVSYFYFASIMTNNSTPIPTQVKGLGLGCLFRK